MLKKWFTFLSLVDVAMQKMGLQKVATPTLTDCIGMEPDLSFFETKLDTPGSKNKKSLFLSPSPEMNMKRLICQGLTDIYEIKKCFRNHEIGPLNSIEFYMLEWYRTKAKKKQNIAPWVNPPYQEGITTLKAGLDRLIEDLYFLMDFLSQNLFAVAVPPFKTISMRDLFQTHLNWELKPHSSQQDFKALLVEHSIPFKGSDDISDLFNLLFLNKIEPFLDPKTPLIVYDYPPFQKAYARLNKEGWAMRFELFWQGMELANAFDEVRSLKEQKARFKAERLKRKRTGKLVPPYPHKLLKNMEPKGLPPTVGIALGLDRLFLAWTGLKDIQQIRLL